MKIYVCYQDLDSRGFSLPQEVFLTAEEAEEWVQRKFLSQKYSSFDYITLDTEVHES